MIKYLVFKFRGNFFPHFSLIQEIDRSDSSNKGKEGGRGLNLR